MDFFKRIFNKNKVTLDLDDIQSILLRSRPLPYFGTIAIFTIRDAAIAKEILKRLVPMISSAEDWHNDEQNTLSIAFTYKGLQKLGLPQSSLDSFPRSFREGMASRAKYLFDIDENAPEKWEKEFMNFEFHVAGALLCKDREIWQAKKVELKNLLESSGGIGNVKFHDFGAGEDGKNVFGFRDGISNPELEGSGIELPDSFEKPIKPGEFILGYPGESGVVKPHPQPAILGKNGTFLTFRKYQSNVAAFNKFIKDNTHTPEEGELLAAKLMGRWRSGAPLILSPEKEDESLGADYEKNNRFSYKDDPFGKKCPFGSHARRMNPRDGKSSVLEDTRIHRIIRRSVSFGDIVPPDVIKDDKKERGLYFIGMSADAMGTTEFLLKTWANDGNSQNLGDEKDPILGLQKNGGFTQPSDPLVKKYRGLQTFNVMQGGEYCFLPSLSALKWISELK